MTAPTLNGQIAQLEGFIGAQKQWQQRLAYDSLGRLKSAREHRGDNNEQSYLLNYDYDLFGNRYQYQSQNGGNPFAQVWVESGQISQTNNRYTSGIVCDDAGNITQDTKFRNLQFQYDANNRQRWSANLDHSGAVTAVFDGAGQRLATISNGVITSISVYDAMGNLVAEYGQGGTSNGTQYLMSDHQSSPRVVMKSSGAAADLVRSRHDYLPFGEEIYAGVGMRTTAQFYNQADGVRQKYAGMEKDDASGMAHTLWRKYDSLSGRWTTTDPYGGSMTLADPQSFNRYIYVNNDPVNQTDPSGLMADADQGWSGASAGFWGTDLNFDPHFGGPAAIAEAEARHDRWVDIDRAGGDYGDDDYPESTEDVTATAAVNSPEPQNPAATPTPCVGSIPEAAGRAILDAADREGVDPTLLSVQWRYESGFSTNPQPNPRGAGRRLNGWDVGPLQLSTNFFNKSPFTDGLPDAFGTVAMNNSTRQYEGFNGTVSDNLRAGARAFTMDILPRSRGRDWLHRNADASGKFRGPDGYRRRYNEYLRDAQADKDYLNCLRGRR